MPLPYAQATRWIILLFLVTVPFQVASVSWRHSIRSSYATDHADAARIQLAFVVAFVTFFTNMLFFVIDEVATQLETPFGHAAVDVDFEKMLRRIDKHTAAQMSLRLGRPCPHYDLFVESRKTGADHKTLGTSNASSIYEVQHEISQRVAHTRVGVRRPSIGVVTRT